MSGGGGGGGGGGGVNGGTDCASFFARTSLNSPDPVVLPDLKSNDILELQMPDPAIPRIIAVAPDGRTAGSITMGRQAALAACIREGFEYVARVVAVSGGNCEVEIRPRAAP
jgi:hypothetical protein